MYSTRQIVEIADRAGVDLDTAEHFAPLLALLAAVQPPPVVPPETLAAAGFDLWRGYTAAEAGTILGIKRTGTLYEIPEAELPRVRVGPARNAVRFFGVDLLCYMRKLKPIDWPAVRDQAEATVLRQSDTAPDRPAAASVRPMPGGSGPVRVL